MNMSYCRFENTASDLADCIEHLDEDPSELNEYERRGRKRILQMAFQIAERYGEDGPMADLGLSD